MKLNKLEQLAAREPSDCAKVLRRSHEILLSTFAGFTIRCAIHGVFCFARRGDNKQEGVVECEKTRADLTRRCTCDERGLCKTTLPIHIPDATSKPLPRRSNETDKRSNQQMAASY